MPQPNRIAAPEAPNGDEPRKPTRRDVTRVVAHAIDSQLGRELPAMMERLIAPALAKLQQDDEDQDEESARGAGGRFVSRGVREIQRQITETKKRIDATDAKAAAEMKKRHSLLIEGKLTEALTKLGVSRHQMRGSAALHRDALRVDDDGELVYTMKRRGYDEDLTLAEALKEWVATDEGRAFTQPAVTRAPARPMGNRSKDYRRDLLAGVADLVGGGQITIESGAVVDGAGGRGPSQTPEAIAEAKQQLMAGVRDLLAGGTLEL